LVTIINSFGQGSSARRVIWFLRRLEREAPRMRLICVPTTVPHRRRGLALRRVGVDATVSDDLSHAIVPRPLFRRGFVCLFGARGLPFEP
jgi:hypothetical protein